MYYVLLLETDEHDAEVHPFSTLDECRVFILHQLDTTDEDEWFITKAI